MTCTVGTLKVSREQAITSAGRKLAWSDLAVEQITPHEQATAAWSPTTPYTAPHFYRSVIELEDAIRAERDMPSIARTGADQQRHQRGWHGGSPSRVTAVDEQRPRRVFAARRRGLDPDTLVKKELEP